VQPDSLFRVASVSKTLTAVAIMELVQQGKLTLDALVFASILTDYRPLPGKSINPDLLKITVRNLLQHTGGWDRSSDETFNGVVYHEPADDLLAAAAQATGHAEPATDADLVTVMLSQPLQHPGPNQLECRSIAIPEPSFSQWGRSGPYR
jgi:N-acyl-D-amino-acid deacylase